MFIYFSKFLYNMQINFAYENYTESAENFNKVENPYKKAFS